MEGNSIFALALHQEDHWFKTQWFHDSILSQFILTKGAPEKLHRIG